MIHIHTQITDRVPLAAMRPRPTEAALRRLENIRATAPVAARQGREAGEIVVRMLGDDDRAALRRLAERDSAGTPQGNLLGAEADGELIAVMSLGDGTLVADPFRATASAVELLRLRAHQLRGGRRERPRRRIHLPKLPRARGALAGSPPGGGSNLLQL